MKVAEAIARILKQDIMRRQKAKAADKRQQKKVQDHIANGLPSTRDIAAVKPPRPLAAPAQTQSPPARRHAPRTKAAPASR